ncbi:hypothetical protein RDI58_011275 [Solanum bulbocastanum]|uniref:Uncharacterized protein n=1 Tax=Solanum bulbocastanum TaxID=147425 RepID=A0AAN8TR04_SOLBU
MAEHFSEKIYYDGVRLGLWNPATRESSLVLYDLTTSEVADPEIDLDHIGCCVFNYKESLTLIKRGDETQDQDNVVDQIEHFFDIIPTDRKSLFTVRGPPTGR